MILDINGRGVDAPQLVAEVVKQQQELCRCYLQEVATPLRLAFTKFSDFVCHTF